MPLVQRRSVRSPERLERRRLVAADRRAAMLARLAMTQTVLQEADRIIGRGWVQCAFYADGSGGSGAAACLVGAVVQAAGCDGDAEPAAKALGAVWSTVLGRQDDLDAAVAPMVRVLRIRELTAWNDAPGRTAAEVRDVLVRTADRVAAARASAAVPA